MPEIFFPQISKPMQFLHEFSYVIFCANIIVIWSKMPAKIMSIKKGDHEGGSGVILLIGKIAGRLLASPPLVVFPSQPGPGVAMRWLSAVASPSISPCTFTHL